LENTNIVSAASSGARNFEEFYHRHGLGNLKFDGSQGPWASDTTITDSRVQSLADFLAGYLNPGTSTIALGDPTRLVL